MKQTIDPNQVIVRNFIPGDLDDLLNYLAGGTEEFYKSIGVDKKKIDIEGYRQHFKTQFELQGHNPNFCIIEYQGRRIGHHNINNIIPRESAIFHGQIWDENLRGSGLGKISGLKAVDHFLKSHDFKRIFIYVPKINKAATKSLEKFKISPIKTAMYEFAMMIEPLDCLVYEATPELVFTFRQKLKI